MLPDYALIESIKGGTPSGIEHAMRLGAKITARDVSGMSVLEVALAWEQPQIARELIRLGADVNESIGKNGDSLLHRAARTGDIGFTILLAEHGANVNVVNDAGKSPLHYAVAGGFQYLADALVNAGANVNAATPQGDTALHIAAKLGDVPMIKSLLKAGAEPLRTNNAGYTALHEAAAAGKTDVVSLLIDNTSLGMSERATLLPRVRLAAELHGHADTALAIRAAEPGASQRFTDRVHESRFACGDPMQR